MQSAELFLLIDPGKYYFLKNIFEGYDGLATVSSVDQKKGVVRLLYPHESQAPLFQLLESLSLQLKKS